ncbi:MAG: translation initiation factor IF-2 [Blastocatellia bacterium]|nr:translation initiation factor IF-2 [Blastocatellia bacterium]
MSKIRIYDLAKELKLDSKKVMDEVRRFGCDVRMASNSVPDDIAEKVRNQYFPKRAGTQNPVKLVKTSHGGPETQSGAKGPLVPERPPLAGPKLIKVHKKVEAPIGQSAETTPTPVGFPTVPTLQPVEEPPAMTVAAPATTTQIITPLVAPPPPVVQTQIIPVPPPVEESEPVEPPTPPVVAEEKEQMTRLVQIETPPTPQPPPLPQPPPQPVLQQPTIREITIPKPPPQPVKPVLPPRPQAPSQTSGGGTFTVRPIAAPPPLPGKTRPPMENKETRPERFERVDRRPAPPLGRGNAPGVAAEAPEKTESTAPAAVPQRTTYIPPKDQKHNKSRRPGARPGGGGGQFAAGKKEHHERELNLRPGRVTSSIPSRPVFTEFKPLKVTEGTTVKELAEKLDVKPKDVVALLFGKGLMVTINQTISEEMMREVGREYGYEVTIAGFEEMVTEQEFFDDQGSGGNEEPRAPVVTVMGHVDHGKTSLLDAIRNTQVAAGEAGGITQHIGAYSVRVPDPDDRSVMRRIVFLDTPGHEAFTLMRARGAKGADVAIIVVAADDGVMPQTVEAIDHARAAGVPMVVAINKIDKPDANVDRVKNALSEHGLLWDGWGGETVMVEISAKKRINLDSLLEMVLLTSDILDLKASPKRLASGVVLEARLDKGRGPVASVLVQHGTLRIGETMIAGLNFGRVRALFDDRGRIVTEAGPAVPVEVLGLQGVPKAGDLFQVVKDAAKAQEIAVWRQSKHRMALLQSSSARGLEEVFEQMKAGKLKELLVILKADVQGSVEVLRDTLEKLSTEKVKVRVIRSDVGAITESDVLLASASNDMAHTSVIIGFNVRPAPRVADLAKQEKVDIRLHTIIYKVEEEMRKAMIGLLDPTTKEVYLGRAEVRQVIRIPKVGNIAGCIVSDGIIKRTCQVRVLRDSKVIYEGHLGSLRRFKEDVSEVKTGFECGIGIDRFNDVKAGDVFEVFTNEKVLPTEL